MKLLADVYVPVLTVSEANRRDHYRAKAKRVKGQRTAVHRFLTRDAPTLLSYFVVLEVTTIDVVAKTVSFKSITHDRGPLTVTLTRISSRYLDDDNLQGALKAVRDETATYLGCGDGPNDPIRWEYAQSKKSGGAGVKITIATQESACP